MDSTPKSPPPIRKPRRWLRRFAILFVLLAIGVWFAPTIAAKTPLRNRIAREALADLKGTVEVGSASFGWFSPIELRDVAIKDAQGRTLLTAPRIASTKSLMSLLRDRSDLGEFTIDRPVVEVAFENGSTNVEDTLAKFLKDESPPSPTRPSVAVKVAGGKLVLHDAGTQSTFENLEAHIAIPAARTEPIAIKARTGVAGSTGTFEADLALGERNSAKFVAVGFPLESLAPIVKRFEASTTVAGKLTANVTATWHADEQKRTIATVEGSTSLRDLDLGGKWLNGDRLRLASAELPLKAEITGSNVKVDRAELKCDVGTLSASGSFDPDTAMDKLFDKPGVAVEGDLDLAKLATLLPRLLRVREGTAIREGKVVLKLASRATPAGATWDGELRTSALKAERDGKPIEWKEPLSVEFSGRVPAGQLPTFDKFICKSDFIAINAKGSPESFRAAANIYLDQLSARLGEFVDLRGAKLAGEASAWVVASRTPVGAFKSDCGVELKQFAFTDGTHRGLAEPALTLKASTTGQWPKDGTIRVETGSLSFTAGADTAELKLLEPIPDAGQPMSGTLSAKLTGDAGKWMNRVRGFVSMPAYSYAGQAVATGTVRFTKDLIAIDRLTLGIDAAKFRGAGLNIDEPRLEAFAELSIKNTAVEFASFRIASAVLSLTEGKLLIEMPADGNMAVSGNGQATSDLERLGRMLKLQSDPKGSDAFHGRGTGPIRFRWQGDTTTFGGTLDLKDFAYGDPKVTGISEPVLKLDLDARYDDTPYRVTFHQVKLERSGLAVDAKGTMANFDTTQDANLTGTLIYDLAKLSPDVRNAIGGGFQAAGQGNRAFALSGSLGTGNAIAKLTADAGLGWDSIKAFGFDMGAGEFTVKLTGGKATLSPIHANFGGGKIAMSPSARFDPPPAEASLAKGKLVDHAKLTPAACASALGYALPVIANAAQAQGEISVIIDDNRLPLADVSKASAKGHIVVHKAAIGPGPVITEIMKLTGSNSTTMTLANEMTVPIRIEGGRVYHENLALTVNGYAIKTTGSVGFDGSLSMIADVPIPGSFPGFKNNPPLKKALEGKIVKVPLTGTVSKPVVDHNVFQTAIATLTRDALKGVGKELINKELEKLFPLMPAPKK